MILNNILVDYSSVILRDITMHVVPNKHLF